MKISTSYIKKFKAMVLLASILTLFLYQAAYGNNLHPNQHNTVSNPSVSLSIRATNNFNLFINGNKLISNESKVSNLSVSLQPGINILNIVIDINAKFSSRITLPDGVPLTTNYTWQKHPYAQFVINSFSNNSPWTISVGRDRVVNKSNKSHTNRLGNKKIVYRKIIFYKVTKLSPNTSKWYLSSGGTYMLYWNGNSKSSLKNDILLDDFKLVIDIPKRLKFIGASGRKVPNTAITASGEASKQPDITYNVEYAGAIYHQGVAYNRYVIHRKQPIFLTSKKEGWVKRMNRNRSGLWIAIKATSHVRKKTKAFPIYYSSTAFNQSWLEIPQKLPVVLLPELQGISPINTTITLYIHSGMLKKKKMEKLYFNTIKSAGVTEIFGETQSKYPKKIGLSQTYFFNWKSSSVPIFGVTEILCDRLLKKFPKSQAVTFSGHLLKRPDLCYLAYHDSVWPLINKQIAGVVKRNPSLTSIFWDYEFPPLPGPGLHVYPMFSKFSISKFSETFGIKQALTPQIINKEYPKQWIKFTNSIVAKVANRLTKICHKYNVQFVMYSGYESNKTHRRYGINWKLVGPNIDRAYCGYSTDKTLIKNTRQALQGTPLVGGLLGGNKTAAQIAQKAISHGGGVLCWVQGTDRDARMLSAIAKASRVISKYENQK